jgi:hypothetical protein
MNLLGGKKSGPSPDKSLLAWANVMAALAEQQVQQKERKAGKGISCAVTALKCVTNVNPVENACSRGLIVNNVA